MQHSSPLPLPPAHMSLFGSHSQSSARLLALHWASSQGPQAGKIVRQRTGNGQVHGALEFMSIGAWRGHHGVNTRWIRRLGRLQESEPSLPGYQLFFLDRETSECGSSLRETAYISLLPLAADTRGNSRANTDSVVFIVATSFPFPVQNAENN